MHVQEVRSTSQHKASNVRKLALEIVSVMPLPDTAAPVPSAMLAQMKFLLAGM